MANAACSRMPSSRWVRRGRMRENTWGKKADQAGGGAARANWGGGGGGRRGGGGSGGEREGWQ